MINYGNDISTNKGQVLVVLRDSCRENFDSDDDPCQELSGLRWESMVDASSPGAPRVAFKPDCRQVATSVSLLSEPLPGQDCIAMDTESTYSGYSYYSGRSRGSHRH
ncbi:hypothetical protein FQN60_006617, partial [Etheostoma spectabile]